jgi:hypothetical protein
MTSPFHDRRRLVVVAALLRSPDGIGIVLDGACAIHEATSWRVGFSGQRLIDLTTGGVHRRSANFGDAADGTVRALVDHAGKVGPSTLPVVHASPPNAKSGPYRRRRAMPTCPGRLGTC